MEKIQVCGVLPGMAYYNLDEAPDEEKILSEHVLTWRGLKNAIKSAKQEHTFYVKTHGNAASHRIYIDVLLYEGDAHYWEGFVEMMGRKSLDEKTILRYRKICRDVRENQQNQQRG